MFMSFFTLLQVVDSLKVGNEALKQVNEMLSIEDVERILDETQEAAEKQRVSSTPFSTFSVLSAFMSLKIFHLIHCSLIRTNKSLAV